jgi:hypothetical protein
MRLAPKLPEAHTKKAQHDLDLLLSEGATGHHSLSERHQLDNVQKFS